VIDSGRYDDQRREWTVPESQAALMVHTGYARRLADGSLELTATGAKWTLDYLRRQEAIENGQRDPLCPDCGARAAIEVGYCDNCGRGIDPPSEAGR
jgi:hypothetical protein